jgi:hypothetical protein
LALSSSTARRGFNFPSAANFIFSEASVAISNPPTADRRPPTADRRLPATNYLSINKLHHSLIGLVSSNFNHYLYCENQSNHLNLPPMKKILLTLALFSALFARAQWEPDVRLTNDTSSSWTSWSTQHAIATCGDSIHVVWQDERTGDAEIYYKRSIDA